MQQQQPKPIATPLVLKGHVFARQQRFMTLPSNLQEDAKQFRAYVEQDKTRLFQNNRHSLVKSIYGVKGKDLITAILHWLQTWHVLAQDTLAGKDSTHKTLAHKSSAPKTLTLASAAANASEAWGAPSEDDPTEVPHSTRCPAVANVRLERAKKIAEALVLSGFITPYKEHGSSITPGHYIHDRTLLIPVAPSVTDFKTTSVWSVLDGAVYAHALKRKGGVLGQLSAHGKDVYVIFNDKTKKLYVFALDLAREPIAELSGATMSVQLDRSRFQFGVRVASSRSLGLEKSELFNAEFKELQELFVSACLRIGATCEATVVKRSTSAYENNGRVDRDTLSDSKQASRPDTRAAQSVAASSISGHARTRPPHRVAFAEAPASTKHRPIHYSVGEHPPSAKHCDDPAGAQPTLAEHEKHQNDSSATSADEYTLVPIAETSATGAPTMTKPHDDHLCIFAPHTEAPAGAAPTGTLLHLGHDASNRDARTFADVIPTMTKHTENGVDVYSAPCVAP